MLATATEGIGAWGSATGGLQRQTPDHGASGTNTMGTHKAALRSTASRILLGRLLPLGALLVCAFFALTSAALANTVTGGLGPRT